jgi:glycerol-3-phosphate dehydrogenase (NAD(P)+)
MSMVAEGVKTSRVVMELAERHDVDLPIASTVFSVVHEGMPATEAYRGLLGRNVRSEMHGMPST